ncbi:MAG TPA: hypothetical protein VGK15_00500 [Candidatus Limnocylindria bacterium]
MGRYGRTVVAAFDGAVMAFAAYAETGGRFALVPADLVLYGSAIAAGICAVVIFVSGAALVAWAAIGYVLFGALLTAGGPHWPLVALAAALMPLVPKPRGSFWIGLGVAFLVALGARVAIGALI